MPSILKIGDGWRAQIRRKGQPTITRTFDKKYMLLRGHEKPKKSFVQANFLTLEDCLILRLVI